MTRQFMSFDNQDGGASETPDKAPDNKPEQINLLDAAMPFSQGMPTEVFPVGLFNPAPETDDPIYYKISTTRDGKTVTVGPFELTGKMIRDWSESTSSNDLDELVSRRAMRASTAMTVKSALFGTVIDMLERGQKPSEAMIRRILPGDLQRAVQTERRKP